MSGIVIAIDPVIGQVGPFVLRWYSLFFGLSVVAGLWLGLREAGRKGLRSEQVQSLAIWGVVGSLLGARLFHVID